MGRVKTFHNVDLRRDFGDWGGQVGEELDGTEIGGCPEYQMLRPTPSSGFPSFLGQGSYLFSYLRASPFRFFSVFLLPCFCFLRFS